MPQAELELEPRLRALYEMARARLQAVLPGFRLELCDRLGPRACAIVLIDPSGRRLPPRVRSQRGRVFRRYQALADLIYRCEMLAGKAPNLGLGQLAWGGNFTGADGRWQVAHWDLGGFRGHGVYRKPQETKRVTQKPAGKPQEGAEPRAPHQG